MNKKLSIITLCSLVLGILAGLFWPELCRTAEFWGTIYINLLKMLIFPVLFTSIVNVVSSGGKEASKTTGISILIFAVMFLASFALCSGIWSILKPGIGFAFEEIEWTNSITTVSTPIFLTNLFPSNIVQSAANNNVFQIVLFAFLFGLALKQTGRDTSFTKTLADASNKLVEYVMYLTPIGVFALISNAIVNFGSDIFYTAIKYIGSAFIGCVLVDIIVMFLPVVIIGKVSLKEYVKGIYKIWLVSVPTCSSVATLPTTMKVCQEDFHVSEKVTDIVVPLGCTIHMCGGAIAFSLLMYFNAQMYGASIDWKMYIMMIMSALIINMGAPGLPGGGIVLGATYMSMFNMPLSFIGFYAAIYKALDMMYTSMNVTGDVTANIIIGKLINENNKQLSV